MKKSAHITSICSITLKLCIFISMTTGLAFTISADDFTGRGTTFLYFTTQSNIWIGITCLLFAVLMIIGLRSKKSLLKNWMFTIKFIFTVAITLTFLVMALLLTPDMIASGYGDFFFTPGNIFPHYITPILAVIDFLFFDTVWQSRWTHSILAAIMPVYYLIFAFICSISGVIFTGGENVPYFFLNYDRLSWFRFTSKGPGVFWWIMILSIFVIGMGIVYIAANRQMRKMKFAKIAEE